MSMAPPNVPTNRVRGDLFGHSPQETAPAVSPIPEVSAITDSSLLVDPAIVEDFTKRHGIDVESMQGSLLAERKALIRYLAEIDFHRVGITPCTSMEFLREELIDSMVHNVALNAYSSPYGENQVDHSTGDVTYHEQTGTERTDKEVEASSLDFGGRILSGLERIAYHSEKIGDNTLDVPTHLIVPSPWNQKTIRKMMGLDKDALSQSLDEVKGAGNLKLWTIEGLDVYFVEAGNHRVLGRQWAGDKTIKAQVITVQLDLEHSQMKDGVFKGTGDDTFYSLLSKVDQKVLGGLGVTDVSRSL